MAAERLRVLPPQSVWEEFGKLNIEYKTVNLGQGYPSFLPPQFVRDHLEAVLHAENALLHQYCPVRGHPELVQQLCKMYSKVLGRDIDGAQVLVTDGATQALSATIQAYINAGDEAVLVEPYYDVYYAAIRLCEGVVRSVPLTPSPHSAHDWKLNEQDLRAAITPRSKMLFLNTPQNIPGKVWTREELEVVAAVAQEHNLIVVSDEVYMHLTYGNLPHLPIASLPNMYERTITISSAGKMFSVTGWKIGWAVAPRKLLDPIGNIVTYQTFCCATPLQVAVARSIATAEEKNYYTHLKSEYITRVRMLCDVLKASGLPPVLPDAGFFVLADISAVDPRHYYDPQDATCAKDWQFCRWLIRTLRVGAIPTTAFCEKKDWPLYENYVRFACCKPESEIRDAAARLIKLKDYMLK